MRIILVLLFALMRTWVVAQCPPGNGESGLELVQNGDFEEGNTGFTSQYNYCNTANCLNPESTYTVDATPNFYHSAFNGTDHTSGSGKFMIINGAGTANAPVWCQTINVTPNTQYLFSTWVCSVVAGSPALLQFSINGVTIGAIFSAPNSTFQWLPFNDTWNSGNSTTATICIVNQNTTLGGNDFGLDDISFQPCVCNFQAPALSDLNICPGDTITTDIQSIATTYLWTPSNGISCATCSVVNIYPAVSTAYSVVSIVNNCSDTTQFIVNVYEPPYADAGNDINACFGAPVMLSGDGNGTFSWSPAQGLNSSTLQNPTILNPVNDQAYILSVVTSDGCVALDTVAVSIYNSISLSLSSDTIICPGDTIVLSAGGAQTYTWSPENSLLNFTTADPLAYPLWTTTYTITAADANGCIAIDSVIVQTHSLSSSPPFDTLICKLEPLVLYPPVGSVYHWYQQQQLMATTDNLSIPTVNSTEVSLVYTDTNGCKAEKQFIIRINNDCDFVELPTAFTPNNDGKNDVFRIIQIGLARYQLSIYNRWGQMIFQTSDASVGWDGTIDGEPAEIGTYVFQLLADLQNGNTVTRQGSVSLIR